MESDYDEDQEENAAEVHVQVDPNDPEYAFSILEKTFAKAIADIEQNPNAAQYAEDFTSLFEALYHKHENVKKLSEEVTTLKYDVEVKTNKLESAIKLADTDQTIITDLKDQIQHAWRMADSAHAREQSAQENIDNLRKQVEALSAELELKNKMAVEPTEDQGQMSKKKEGLQREKDRLVGEVAQLTQKIQNALGYQEELEHKNSAADLKINELSGKIDDQHAELEKNKKTLSKQQGDIADLKSKIDEKDKESQDLNIIINYHLKQISVLEAAAKEERNVHEKLLKSYEDLNISHMKQQEDYNAVKAVLEHEKMACAKKTTDLRVAEDTINHLRNDIVKLNKMKEQYDKRLLMADGDKNELQQERAKLRQRVALFEKEIEELKRAADQGKRAMDQVIREKDILNKSILRQHGVANDLQKLVKLQEQQKKKLEVELDTFYMETNKQKKTISRLEREKERMSEEQLDLMKQIEENLDQLKLRKAQIFEMKKAQTEQINKYKIQQNLFDSVRADRNALQKQLQESSAECGELKKKLKITTHQTEQLKEDISMKEQLMIKEENVLRKVVKEKEYLRVELNNATDQIKKLKEEILALNDEGKRLHLNIMQNEKLIREQAKDLEQLMNERDILGSQLVRRNDEVVLLNEKINILQTTLQRGEAQYDQRLEDIKLLKIEIKRLRQEKMLLNKSADNMADLRQEVFHLERDLTRARLKCRALEEEVQNPLNIHRWRKLEGSDPEVLDLLQKIQILQKRLLQQASHAVERERQLKEAERLYLNLRQVLAQQPGPSVKEDLNKTQRSLKIRNNKLKCMVSELNMAEYQLNEYKFNLQRVTEELNDLKKKYLAEKKSQEAQRASNSLSQEVAKTNENRKSQGSQPSRDSQSKFIGGGYRMSVDRPSIK